MTLRELIHLKVYPKPTKPQQEKLEQIIKAFKQGGLNPLHKRIAFLIWVKKEDSLLDYLTHSGILVKITEEMYLDREIYQGCLEKLQEYFRENQYYSCQWGSATSSAGMSGSSGTF